jgi:hypothetical protein
VPEQELLGRRGRVEKVMMGKNKRFLLYDIFGRLPEEKKSEILGMAQALAYVQRQEQAHADSVRGRGKTKDLCPAL